MADDSTFRSTRPGSPYGRPDKSARPSDDPLAELARLIGKNDPYAEFGLREPHPEQPEENDPTAEYVRDDRYGDRHYESSAQQDYEPQHDEGFRHPADYHERSQHLRTQDLRTQDLRSQDLPPAHAPRQEEEWASGDRYDYRDSRFASAAPEAAYAHSESYDEQQAHDGGYDEQDGYDRDQRYDHPAFDDNGEDQIYDDPPRARRHGGLATALALIGCAVLGTAGAYAYRSYYTQPGSAQPPPVITADTSTPTKIVPAPASDLQSGKVIQDRVANAGREQVISKQEEPIALKDLGTQAAPRVVLPAPVAPAPPTAAPQQSSSSAAPGSNEPKKVHTVAIRPEGTDVSGKPTGAPGSPRGGPDARGSGPLSLEPQAAPPPAPPAPRARMATAPAASSSEPVSASAASSGFLVQLSSQKTEAEAAASFRSLQAKFPNELGGRRPIVRRADLGSKGVFYRTMVGPFASAQDANEFCASYKVAGGHCVVPSH